MVARCSVDYAGRLTAHLPTATRLILVKADGSVSVHADGGSYKPLNWMSPPCTLARGGRRRRRRRCGRSRTRPASSCVITHRRGPARLRARARRRPRLVKDGVEAHLQELLAEQVEVLGEGWQLVRREYPTAIGPVDLLCRDARRARGRRRDQAPRRDRRRRAAHPLPRAAEPRPAARPGARGLRRPGDQAAGADAGRATAASAAWSLDYDALRGVDDAGAPAVLSRAVQRADSPHRTFSRTCSILGGATGESSTFWRFRGGEGYSRPWASRIARTTLAITTVAS